MRNSCTVLGAVVLAAVIAAGCSTMKSLSDKATSSTKLSFSKLRLFPWKKKTDTELPPRPSQFAQPTIPQERSTEIADTKGKPEGFSSGVNASLGQPTVTAQTNAASNGTNVAWSKHAATQPVQPQKGPYETGPFGAPTLAGSQGTTQQGYGAHASAGQSLDPAAGYPWSSSQSAPGSYASNSAFPPASPPYQASGVTPPIAGSRYDVAASRYGLTPKPGVDQTATGPVNNTSLPQAYGVAGSQIASPAVSETGISGSPASQYGVSAGYGAGTYPPAGAGQQDRIAQLPHYTGNVSATNLPGFPDATNPGIPQGGWNPGGPTPNMPGNVDYQPGSTEYQPGNTGYNPGQTGYNPPGVPPYQPPVTQYQFNTDSPKQTQPFTPGSVKPFEFPNSPAPQTSMPAGSPGVNSGALNHGATTPEEPATGDSTASAPLSPVVGFRPQTGNPVTAL